MLKVGQATASESRHTTRGHTYSRIADCENSYDCCSDSFSIRYNFTFNNDSKDFCEHILIKTIGPSFLQDNTETGSCILHKDYVSASKQAHLAIGILCHLYEKFKDSLLFTEIINKIQKHLKNGKKQNSFKLSKKVIKKINNFAFDSKGLRLELYHNSNYIIIKNKNYQKNCLMQRSTIINQLKYIMK